MLSTFNALRRVTRALRMASACVILLVMLITGYDVVMRYVFAQPLSWSITISMVGLVAIVMLTVPDLEADDSHIGMDLFYRGFGRAQTAVADIITLVATFVFCTVSGIAAALTSFHFFTAGMRTAGTFNMPVWIGYALVALGLLLAAVMTLLRYILKRQGALIESADDDAAAAETSAPAATSAQTAPKGDGDA